MPSHAPPSTNIWRRDVLNPVEEQATLVRIERIHALRILPDFEREDRVNRQIFRPRVSQGQLSERIKLVIGKPPDSMVREVNPGCSGLYLVSNAMDVQYEREQGLPPPEGSHVQV